MRIKLQNTKKQVPFAEIQKGEIFENPISGKLYLKVKNNITRDRHNSHGVGHDDEEDFDPQELVVPTESVTISLMKEDA